MEEQLITFETAKLAKEKGFNEMCHNAYHIYRENLHKSGLGLVKLDLEFEPYMGGQSSIIKEFYQSKHYTLAPTQSLLQKWLREKHSIFCEVKVGLQHNDFMFSSYIITKDGRGYKFRSNFYDTYEEALKYGLQEALKLINKN